MDRFEVMASHECRVQCTKEPERNTLGDFYTLFHSFYVASNDSLTFIGIWGVSVIIFRINVAIKNYAN